MTSKAVYGVIVLLVIVIGAGAALFLWQSAPAGQPSPAEQKIKIAAVLPGTIEDLSFNTDAYKALVAIQRDYNVTIAFTDQVGPADWEKVASAYASQGYNVVYLHGAEFTDIAYKLAKKYPDTFFICGPTVGVDKPLPDNLLYINPKNHETGFVGGAVAAMLSKTGKVGIVMGVDYPAVVRVAEGFKLGAKYVNPDVQVMVAYAGTWTDPQKGKTIANAMIDQGVDVITHWADLTGLGALDAARERGIIALGGISDQLHYAPNIATSVMLGVYDYVYWALSHYIKGDLPKGVVYEFGFKDGLHPLGDWNKNIVSQKVIDKAKEIEDKIKSGEIKVPLITTPTD